MTPPFKSNPSVIKESTDLTNPDIYGTKTPPFNPNPTGRPGSTEAPYKTIPNPYGTVTPPINPNPFGTKGKYSSIVR